jgi:hypothetical protein
VTEAFADHLLGPIAFAATAVLAVVWGVEAVTGRAAAWVRRLAYSAPVAWTLAGVLVAYHVARLAGWLLSGELVQWMRASWGGRALAWMLGLFGG